MVHFKANKVPYLLDWVQLLDWGHGRPLKFVNRILLPEFSYNASSERSGVFVHKDWHVCQWTIRKMGYKVCGKHVVVVCNDIDVTL
jgi:hypothetical protein